MVCQACGTPITPETRFCSHCGARIAGTTPAGTAPAQPSVGPAYQPTAPGYPYQAGPYQPSPLMYRPPVVPRVQRNLQTLSILWFIYAGFRILTGIAGMFFMRAMSLHGFDNPWMMGGRHFMWPMWMGALMPWVAGVTVIATVLAVLVGFSLMTRKPWGRVLAIVVAILALFRFPVGTALGIYTLWVLAPTQSGLEYDAIADRT
jgi:hypothetical protein